MNTYHFKRCLTISLAALLFAGCLSCPRQHDEAMVAALPRLTTAVQGALLYSATPVPDNQAVAAVLKARPDLARIFLKYPILVRRDGKDVVLLVCSPDGTRALYEDTSRTDNKVDILWCEKKPAHPAQFSLVPNQAPDMPVTVKPAKCE